MLDQARGFVSDEHFTVNRTLIEAWARQKSFQKKDGSDSGDGTNFRSQERRNDMHASKTDPDAKLYRKGGGQESRMSYLGHVMVENRNGLIVGAMATTADGFAKRDAALLMVHERPRPREPIHTVRPHVSQNQINRRSAIDARTLPHGSVYMSDDFQNEIRFLGIESSQAFVQQPEGNGCIERFFRTLKEQLLWIRYFRDLEELHAALIEFRDRYNRHWIPGRLGYRTPAQTRRDFDLALPAAA